MADIFLSQSEADTLLKMEKINPQEHANITWPFPDLGGGIEVPLISKNKREAFSLDISRKRIALTAKYQMRGRQVVVLARLDFASPHRNPDGEEIGIPHLHLYREGFGDKWAVPVPSGLLSNPDAAWQCLLDFMKYCNVISAPNISRGLFT